MRRTLLFLHGIPDSGSAWAPLIARLPPEYTCLAPDLPGFGSRAPPDRLATLADLRSAVARVIAELPLPAPFTLVVHDVGGLFGLTWAVAHPERLERLVILNASIFPDRHWHWGARILRTPGLGELALRAMTRGAFRAEMRRAAHGNLSDAEIDATLDRFGPTARRTALRLYRVQTPTLLRDLPAAVRALTESVPALVVWGCRDSYLPASFADRFGARRVRRCADLGHWPHREAPERVAAAIQAFLEPFEGRAS